MDISLLLRGIVIGLSLAAPVGPMGVLTIRRTLAHGRLTGFVSGMGTATADAVYGLIGALGLTVISTALTSQAFWLRLVGGVFLCYLGARTLISKPAEAAAQTAPTRAGLLGVFAGSALWWLLLSWAASLLRTRPNTAVLVWVNRLSGLIIVGFGLAALASSLG